MSTRLYFTAPDELAAAVEVARGDVSRSRWLLRVVESALRLDAELGPGAPTLYDELSEPAASAPAEKKSVGSAGWSRGPRAPVKPIPKRK